MCTVENCGKLCKIAWNGWLVGCAAFSSWSWYVCVNFGCCSKEDLSSRVIAFVYKTRDVLCMNRWLQEFFSDTMSIVLQLPHMWKVQSCQRTKKTWWKLLIFLCSEDVPATPPFLSVLSSINDKGPDICLAAGFFPGEKTMTLKLTDGKDPVSLTTSNAPLLKSTKTYYYAGFNDVNKIQQCEMDGKYPDTNPDPDTPLTTPGLYLKWWLLFICIFLCYLIL